MAVEVTAGRVSILEGALILAVDVAEISRISKDVGTLQIERETMIGCIAALMAERILGNDLLRPGDLVFFATLGGKSPTHVGIYAGNGQFLHAPNSRSKVSYGDLTSGYWLKCYIGARRLT